MAEPEQETNIKENDVEEIVVKKKERKPLSDEAKKIRLENLKRGRELAHQKRRELEARYKEEKNLEKEPEPEPVVEKKVKVPKKKKVVYVEEDSSSSEEEIQIIKKKKEKKVTVKPPPVPKFDEEAERKRIMELVRVNTINQQKQKNKNAYMKSIFGE